MKELLQLIVRRKWKGLFYTETTNGWIQLFRYGLVGGSAFVADFSAYCFLEWLGVYYLFAGIFSFAAGFTFNFLVSRWLIFRANAEKKATSKELAGVLAISFIGLLLTELLLFAGIDFLCLDSRLSKIIASITALLWNYTARRYFVYR